MHKSSKLLLSLFIIILFFIIAFLVGQYYRSQNKIHILEASIDEYQHELNETQDALKDKDEELKAYTVTNSELLSCPFCGSNNVGFEESFTGGYMIRCNDCYADSGFHNPENAWGEFTKEESRDRWNNLKR